MRDRSEWLRFAFWGWSAAAALLIASAAVWSVAHGSGDWRVFVAAGSLAGTRALLDPPEAWQIFVYLPGAAWAFTPFAHLPLAVSFTLDALLMLACAAVAGSVAARSYGLSPAFGSALYVTWPPVVYAAAIIGQNAPLGLLLAQLTLAGLARGSRALTAVPLGLLLYKPTYALPLIAVLVVLRRGRELGVVALFAAAWYLAGVAAAGGAWDWPSAWMRLIARYAPGDLSVNAAFVINVPGLLARAGLGAPLVAALTAVGAAIVLLALRRVDATEAGAAACLAGVALGPHALAYDAALALPMIALTAARQSEGARIRFLFALYVFAPLFFISPLLRFDPLALVVIGGTCAWTYVRLRSPSRSGRENNAATRLR